MAASEPNGIDDEPSSGPALTPEQLQELTRPGDPDFPSDPSAPTDEEEWITIPGPDARRVRMTNGAKWMLEQQAQRFREKFGREIGPGDPVFFDPEADTPQPMSAETMAGLSDLWETLKLERTREITEARMEEQGMVERFGPKVGRNDPCPCGSGLKFKKCHGA